MTRFTPNIVIVVNSGGFVDEVYATTSIASKVNLSWEVLDHQYSDDKESLKAELESDAFLEELIASKEYLLIS